MKLSNILNAVLAIVIVCMAAYLFTQKAESPAGNSNPVIDNILNRTSIRAYQQRAIAPDTIEQILRAGMAAPTAVNKQPWAFIVITDADTRKALADRLPYAKMTEKAPLAIVVCGDLSKSLEGDATDFWIQDVSAATENILLAAHSFGLGAVWTGVYPLSERVKAVQEVLSLPEHIIPLNVVPIGFPAEQPVPKDKWKIDNIHSNKW